MPFRMVVTVLVAVSGQLMKVRPGLMSACLMAQLTPLAQPVGTLAPASRSPQSPEDEGGKTMICQFCKEDVKDPCHNRQETEERASWRIERCERALQAHQGGMSGADARDIQGGGRH
jgi:hypothetical protein